MKHNPFVREDYRLSDTTQEMSSEDSEIDSVDAAFPDYHFLAEKIDVNIMGELQEVLDSYKSKLKLGENSNQYKNETPVTSLRQASPSPVPLPPPRPPKSRARTEVKTEEPLIKLDSSPEDLDTLFDPIKQKLCTNGESYRQARNTPSIYQTRNINPLGNNSFIRQNSLSSQPLDQISSNIKNNHLNSNNSIQDIPSFLHSPRWDNPTTGAFHSSQNQVNVSTNPFAETSRPSSLYLPMNCNNVNLEKSANLNLNSFSSEWQKFE